jgi:hypothetical protein
VNCKPGDLAIIVHSAARNEGKIVRCLRAIRDLPLVTPRGVIERHPGWEIDTTVVGFGGAPHRNIWDHQLRPIRDEDGEDETLTWAPRKETA